MLHFRLFLFNQPIFHEISPGPRGRSPKEESLEIMGEFHPTVSVKSTARIHPESTQLGLDWRYMAKIYTVYNATVRLLLSQSFVVLDCLRVCKKISSMQICGCYTK